MRPENMDEWTASEWSLDLSDPSWRPRDGAQAPALESDDVRFSRAKDITPSESTTEAS